MTPGEPHPSLTQALHRLLRPLIRVLIAKGMTFTALSRLLKELYVEVAQEDFQEAGKPVSDSRVSLLTGVHRKDIKALRENPRALSAPSRQLSRNAHLVSLWTGAPEYLDDRGNPRPLPFKSHGSAKGSFETLVESVSKDIRPRAVLDEWLRQDLASIDGEDLIHLNTRAFVPSEDFADLAYYFGRNLRDHIAASSHNLLDEKPPMLEQAVYYENLSSPSVDELAALSRSLGSDVLVKVNQRAFELAEQDKGKGEAGERMTFGIYFYNAPDDEHDPEKSGGGDKP